MYRKTLTRSLCSLVLSTLFAGALAAPKQIVGYWANWDVYSRNYPPAAIPYKKLTTVLYAFAGAGNCMPNTNPSNPFPTKMTCTKGTFATGNPEGFQLFSSDPYSDFNTIPTRCGVNGSVSPCYATGGGQKGKGSMSAVISGAHSAGGKALLSIGGWSLSEGLQQAMLPDNQHTFVASVISFLDYVKTDSGDAVGFDGIDIDYEPNANQWGNVTPDQLNNFVTTLTALKAALKAHNPAADELTIAISANPTPALASAVAKLAQAGTIDYVNLMTYDLHGAFDSPKVTNFSAPIVFDPTQPTSVVGRTTFNVETTIQTYLKAGVPANKLIVGFPAYGHGLVGVPRGPNANTPGLYQPFTGSSVGTYQDGTYTYHDIMTKLIPGGAGAYSASTHQGHVRIGSWIYNPTTQEFVSYDSAEDVTLLASYVQQKQLAGLMVWELSGDPDNQLIGAAQQSLD